MSSTATVNLNQIEVTHVRAYIGRVRAAPELAGGEPHVIARWAGEIPGWRAGRLFAGG